MGSKTVTFFPTCRLINPKYRVKVYSTRIIILIYILIITINNKAAAARTRVREKNKPQERQLILSDFSP